MAGPLRDKARLARFLADGGGHALDVGCADGTVTRALAGLRPDWQFYGIDLEADFIARARRATRRANLRFDVVYLRELLAHPERFDAVIFCSVLHEFFTYGEGISSVLKAIADAWELLRPGGRIVIRDMILDAYTQGADLDCARLAAKVRERSRGPYLADFEARFGRIDRLYALNHFLLKYWYVENWAREGPEHYVPVTLDQYSQIFALLGLRIQQVDAYLLPFLARKWQADFGFAPEDLRPLRSTCVIVGEKD
jgi:SAM-dependent methyltransferase